MANIGGHGTIKFVTECANEDSIYCLNRKFQNMN